MFSRYPTVIVLSAIAVCTWRSEPVSALPAGPVLQRHFTLSEECGLCHIAAPGASAMKDGAGNDVSPYYTWQATMMANAFRDPYFRAQLQKETAASGEAVQELCLRCHTPMVHHEARLTGEELPRLAQAVEELEADDGVSCTVCHTISAEGLGEASTFSGQPNFDGRRVIYGPYDDVFERPMQMHVDYTPKQGKHVSSSAMCATCHTLHTEHNGTPFPEQTPYLEWRNSEFNDEREDADPAKTKTCQECHMPDIGKMRIARNPMGFDFGRAKPREPYRSHAIVGGNAFMIDMLREHRGELLVEAEPEQLAAVAAAARHQLANDTARLQISELQRDGAVLEFAIDVENLTGHKFPTGYPSRRAWLKVEVLVDGKVVFASGAVGDDGRLVGVDNEFGMPHVQTIERADQVVVYELVATDPEGEPTTFLTKMVGKQKDNRLLPRGYDAAGPHVDDIAPVGVDQDEDFVGGGDRVACRISLPEDSDGACEVRVELLYQTVPPVWADALRSVDAEEARRFVRYYDAAPKRHELVASARRAE